MLNKHVNFARKKRAPDSLHSAPLRYGCRLHERYVSLENSWAPSGLMKAHWLIIFMK